MSLTAVKSFFNPSETPLENKVSAEFKIQDFTIPPLLYFPIKTDRFEDRRFIKNIGDKVLAGEVIANTKDGNQPLHSSTSGVIKGIEKQPSCHFSGEWIEHIVLQSDGEHSLYKNHHLSNKLDNIKQLHNQFEQSGIVGMGGGGFPTINKIKECYQKKVQTLLINLCECEPIISCDDGLVKEYPFEVLQGIKILLKAIAAKQAIIVIEDNKPLSIAALEKELAQFDKITLQIVKSIYPSGHEHQLVNLLSDSKIQSKQRPTDLQMGVFNAATCFACYQFFAEGLPLIKRVITISNIEKSINQWVLIGTPFDYLFNQQKIVFDANYQQLIMGGPMNGVRLQSIQSATTKITNSLLVLVQEKKYDAYLPCIRCGDCQSVCPVDLIPQQLYWYAQNLDNPKALDYHLFDCIECGNCAFVCPSYIPLIQFFRHHKKVIADENLEQAKANFAKQRYEQRNNRLERDRKRHKEQLQKHREIAKQKHREYQAKGEDEVQDNKEKKLSKAVQLAQAKALARKQKIKQD